MRTRASSRERCQFVHCSVHILRTQYVSICVAPSILNSSLSFAPVALAKTSSYRVLKALIALLLLAVLPVAGMVALVPQLRLAPARTPVD